AVERTASRIIAVRVSSSEIACTSVYVRQWPPGTDSTRRSPAGAQAPSSGHPGLQARFIDEHEAGGIDACLALAPVRAEPGDIGAILFGCPRGLFLNRQPQRRSVSQSVFSVQFTCRAASRSCNVASG
ncbi:MAG: hypothetical protein KDA68_16910, partial [Planctomycetaceae bacterium]|nr:hypothetical protein [Planctomycetaceae bacterium]